MRPGKSERLQSAFRVLRSSVIPLEAAFVAMKVSVVNSFRRTQGCRHSDFEDNEIKVNLNLISNLIDIIYV